MHRPYQNISITSLLIKTTHKLIILIKAPHNHLYNPDWPRIHVQCGTQATQHWAMASQFFIWHKNPYHLSITESDPSVSQRKKRKKEKESDPSNIKMKLSWNYLICYQFIDNLVKFSWWDYEDKFHYLFTQWQRASLILDKYTKTKMFDYLKLGRG